MVEDNAVNQELALEILQSAGMRVDVAENGVQAIEKIGQADYDGVLMDCQMPVMDGFEATRKIRQEPRFSDIPILAMTANAMEGDKEKCIASGMNDHISKPIDIAQLFNTLARWIKPKPTAVTTDTPVDMELLVIDLRKLESLLAEDDSESVDAMNNVIDRLKAIGYSDAAKNVQASISTFDFEDALVKLKEVLKTIEAFV